MTIKYEEGMEQVLLRNNGRIFSFFFSFFFKVSKGYESLVFLPTICSFLEEIRRGFISCDKEMSSWHPAGCAAAAARRQRSPNHNSLWGQKFVKTEKI